MPVIKIPTRLLCSLTKELLKEPVIADDGYIYEKAAIEEWFKKEEKISPITKKNISGEFTPDRKRKKKITEFLERNKICTFEELLKAVQIRDWKKFKELNYLDCHLAARDEGGWTLLHWAAAHCEEVLRMLLINKKVNLEPRDNRGMTPLHVAVHNSNYATVKLLLDANANLEAEDNEGSTPLYSAVVYSRTEMVELLLANGANPEVTHEEKTLVQVAKANGKKEIASIILKKIIEEQNKRISQLQEQLSQPSLDVVAPPSKLLLSSSANSFFSSRTEVKQQVSGLTTEVKKAEQPVSDVSGVPAA